MREHNDDHKLAVAISKRVVPNGRGWQNSKDRAFAMNTALLAIRAARLLWASPKRSVKKAAMEADPE